MRCANADLPRSETTIHSGDGCFGDSSGGCFDAGPGWRSAPHRIHESSSKAYRAAVFGLWERARGHRLLLYSVATLPGGLPRGCHGDYWSSTVDPPDGAAGFVPATITMASAWTLSVDPAENVVSTGQSQYCRRCSFTESTQCKSRGISSAGATEGPRCRRTAWPSIYSNQFCQIGQVRAHRVQRRTAGRPSVEDLIWVARNGVAAQEFWDIPSRDTCQGGGRATKTSGPKGNATENLAGEPWCSDSWTRGDPTDSGPGQTDILVARLMEWCGPLRAVMSGLSADEIGQSEKGRCFAAHSATCAGLAANHHRSGDWLTRVGWQDRRSSLRGPLD